jgi:hypothetical protein
MNASPDKSFWLAHCSFLGSGAQRFSFFSDSQAKSNFSLRENDSILSALLAGGAASALPGSLVLALLRGSGSIPPPLSPDSRGRVRGLCCSSRNPRGAFSAATGWRGHMAKLNPSWGLSWVSVPARTLSPLSHRLDLRRICRRHLGSLYPTVVSSWGDISHSVVLKSSWMSPLLPILHCLPQMGIRNTKIQAALLKRNLYGSFQSRASGFVMAQRSSGVLRFVFQLRLGWGCSSWLNLHSVISKASEGAHTPAPVAPLHSECGSLVRVVHGERERSAHSRRNAPFQVPPAWSPVSYCPAVPVVMPARQFTLILPCAAKIPPTSPSSESPPVPNLRTLAPSPISMSSRRSQSHGSNIPVLALNGTHSFSHIADSSASLRSFSRSLSSVLCWSALGSFFAFSSPRRMPSLSSWSLKRRTSLVNDKASSMHLHGRIQASCLSPSRIPAFRGKYLQGLIHSLPRAAMLPQTAVSCSKLFNPALG